MDNNTLEKEAKKAGLALAFHCKQSVDSTNRWAKAAVKEGVGKGNVFVADHQSAGYGRMGHEWASPPAKNLLFSFIEQFPAIKMDACHLVFVYGTACHETLTDSFPSLRPMLKWPNDLMVGRRKIGGLLLETAGDKIVVGIGLNVNALKNDYPENLKEKVTTIKEETGEETDRRALLIDLLVRCDKQRRLYDKDGLPVFINYWNRYNNLVKRRVKVTDGEKIVDGVVTGINQNAFLTVQTDHGPETIIAGDVELA